jgi:hypothetical protein
MEEKKSLKNAQLISQKAEKRRTNQDQRTVAGLGT